MNTNTVTRMMFIQLCVVGSSACMITMKYYSYDICARFVCAVFVNTMQSAVQKFSRVGRNCINGYSLHIRTSFLFLLHLFIFVFTFSRIHKG